LEGTGEGVVVKKEGVVVKIIRRCKKGGGE
jgi:hypothetical protein